jgi:serine phosphatase RsbU (regulator of sigma subunit)
VALRARDILGALGLAAAGGTVTAGAAALGPGIGPAALAATTASLFLGYRIVVERARPPAAGRTGESAQTPLARLTRLYARRAPELDSEAEVAAATDELLEVGLGFAQVTLIIPSSKDYSWHRADGTLLEERAAPDPRLLPWLLEMARPVDVASIDELIGEDLRAPLTRLLGAHEAEFVLPLAIRDEIGGIILAGSRAERRALDADQLAFLRDVMDQGAAALVHVRMKRAAIERVALAKDVELTAAVQASFIPPREEMNLGALRLAGAYVPASRCGGDWWSYRPLAGGRALVLIGDATGHGISAAMVTAAAKGCADVVLERLGDEPDLGQILDTLDAAIRRVGGGNLHMTIFVTLLDPRAGEVHYANAGHNVPYVCRPREGKRPELKVLPARGNPLGSGEGPVYELGRRPLLPGDVIVWYTDGIVDGHGEGRDGERSPYGDRRMQRALRELTSSEIDVVAIRDGLLRASLSYQGRRRPDDDMTAVVAALERPT